ncbi:FAD-dependent oxidoreductase [Microlunatus speluncae]|uniref:FAD-dependent oxidoreductase n=1 Tax=Microlunatus speluncae TaxID=2594267 RepID=UPI001C2D0B74|nr:FAD-dependent monooxygenase [Microlunatus speluncae]
MNQATVPDPVGANDERLRVIVVGGGIGGLALAAGLRRHDFEVVVFDRDHDVAATGGYHITLDGRAQLALQQLIEPDLYERLLASSSALRLRDPDVFWDRRGRLLGQGRDLGSDPSIDIDRITLRLLLADAAGNSLKLGHTVTEVAPSSGSGPSVTLADGVRHTAELIVGADGAHSVVARHLAGGPTNQPAGLIGFSGRTPSPALDEIEQLRLGPRSSMTIGPRGAALYVGFLDPVGRAVLDAPELRSAITTGPTYIWGAMFPESSQTNRLRKLAGTALRDALLHRFRGHRWTEQVLQVIERTDPGSIAAFRFNAASSKPQDLAPWPAGPITALGDAVHATPPTAGMGAGAAIRDAADLLRQLRAVRAKDKTLSVAINDYETTLRARGSEVLTLAMKTVRWILATDTPIGAAATAVVTPILGTVRRLRS